MKALLILALVAHTALACPAPAEYPKGKPFLECPSSLTKKRVEVACDKPGSCAYGTQQIWHYKMSGAKLLSAWEALLGQAGWKVERVNPVGSKGVPPPTWVRATKGKQTWDTHAESDGQNSQLWWILPDNLDKTTPE